MRENLLPALRHILKFEGGYADHPLDPGGATNMGITKATLERFRGRPVSKAEVRGLGSKEVAEIYKRFYWDQAFCDKLPPGIDLAVFDCAVNQGVSRAKSYLIQAVRLQRQGLTLAKLLATIKAADQRAVLLEFMALRMRHYGLLRRLFPTFGLGWSRRLMATLAEALSLQDAKARAKTKSNDRTWFSIKETE